MPITEGTFTADELHAAVTANPALGAQIKTFGEKGGYVVRTKDEDTAFLGNFEKQKIDAKTFEFATGIEKDVKEIFGVDKLENEKYHEYLKRVAKETVGSLSSMKTELAALKADPNNSTADKQRIQQLEAAILTEKQGAGTKLQQKDAEIFKLKSGFEIEKAMAKIRPAYVLGLPEIAITATESAIINNLLPTLKEIEGKVLVMNADGTPKLNQSTYQPVTLEEELKGLLVDIIDKNKIQTGTGTSQQQQQQQQQQQSDVQGVVKDAAGKITDISAIPETVKNKVQLHEYLTKLGLTEDSTLFNTAFTKFGEKLPTR